MSLQKYVERSVYVSCTFTHFAITHAKTMYNICKVYMYMLQQINEVSSLQ